MGLKPGQTNNPNGRPPGSKNKVTDILRDKVTEFLRGNFDQVTDDIMSLEPRYRVKFYLDLLQYSLPRVSSIQITEDFENMTNEQLDIIIERIRNNGEKK